MSSYLAVMHEIHVLFVDHELNYLNTTSLLETCQYKVTHVAVAGDAQLLLANGKVKFDFVIANINSPDLQVFKLLQQAVSLDIPMILMSIDDDTITAMRVIEIGAFLYVKRPTSPEMLRTLWQHVARERTRAMRESERLMAANYGAPRGNEFREMPGQNPNNFGAGNNSFMAKNKAGKFRENYYKGKRVDEEYDSDSNMSGHGRVKRKVCTEWTQELHEKFMDAVEQLGEGKCFPKEILELMNVPGLTRMQVASHLQKCRNDNWRAPEERKSTLSPHPMSSDCEGPSLKPRRFGSMPRAVKSPSSGNEAYGQAGSGVGQGSRSHTKSVIDAQTTRVPETVSMNNQISYNQHYGALVPHANNIVPQENNIVPAGMNNSSNLRNLSSTDGFFNLDTADCFIQNSSSLSQGFAAIDHPQSSSRPYPFESTYVTNQANSKNSRNNQWTGSGNSNFCSDESTKGN